MSTIKAINIQPQSDIDPDVKNFSVAYILEGFGTDVPSVYTRTITLTGESVNNVLPSSFGTVGTWSIIAVRTS
jgi:hypothetical protein